MARYEEQIENLLVEDIGTVQERERTAFDRFLVKVNGQVRPHRDEGREFVCYTVPPPRFCNQVEGSA